MFRLCLFLSLIMMFLDGAAQNETDEQALLNVEKGVSFSRDSLFMLNLRFRMQNRAGIRSISGQDLGIDEVDARIRRLRLRFDGFVMSPRFSYYIQLSFSKADQDLEDREVAQTIRDAIMYYHFNTNFYVGFGQAKLPGNRQRVVSSGNMQFAERSLANSLFTIDRDFGLFAYWRPSFAGGERLAIKAALTSGEGRNASPGNSGLSYTARVEWLPFGAFLNNGDYSEGDLEFEPSPKLSLAASANYNHNAQRTGGQTGNPLFEPRNITSYTIDGMWKYNGWMLSSEWLWRRVADPITSNETGDIAYLITGSGWNTQFSKMLNTKTEAAFRYTRIMPNEQQMEGLEPQRERLLWGMSRYLNGHRIKMQGHVGYHWENGNANVAQIDNYWLAVFQVEFGI